LVHEVISGVELLNLIERAFENRRLGPEPLTFSFEGAPAGLDTLQLDVWSLANRTLLHATSWKSLNAQDMRYLISYLTPDALCFILPALLSYNVTWCENRRHFLREYIWEIEDLLQPDNPEAGKSESNAESILGRLSALERASVFEYVKYFNVMRASFTPDLEAFWEGPDDGAFDSGATRKS